MAFFEYCVPCRQMFVSEAAWHEHQRLHEQKRQEKKETPKPFDEVEQKVIMETAAQVPGADTAEIEDARLAKTKDLRAIKKELKKAGIECQTMTAAEAKAAYEKAVAAGKIVEE